MRGNTSQRAMCVCFCTTRPEGGMRGAWAFSLSQKKKTCREKSAADAVTACVCASHVACGSLPSLLFFSPALILLLLMSARTLVHKADIMEVIWMVYSGLGGAIM